MYAAMIQVCTILFTHYCCMLDLYLHLSGKLMYCRNMTARLHLQTEIKGVRHPHGLAEGWKWLAMFLNALPATTATACALHAFLKVKMHLKTHSFCVHVVNWNCCALSDGRFCTSQKIWITIPENPGCDIAVLFTSSERSRQQNAVRGCQQSTELSEWQNLPPGTGRAVPCSATTVQRVVHVKIKTPDRHGAVEYVHHQARSLRVISSSWQLSLQRQLGFAD